MKNLILLLFLCLGTFSFSQEYTDTLHYKSGMIRHVHITKQVGNTIYYDYVNAKGKVISSSVNAGQLKKVQGNVADSNKTIKLKPKSDSIPCYQSNIAFNPGSPFLLGFNITYLSRFGENYRHCLYIPVRATTFLASAFYGEVGVGYAYVLQQNVNMTFFMSFTPTAFFFEDEPGVGLMFAFNGIKNLTPRVTLNGSFGTGPAYVPAIWETPLWFTASVGIGFNVGNNKIINK